MSDESEPTMNNAAEAIHPIDNVVRLDEEMVADLKKKRLIREQVDAFQIELSAPQPGETTIGYLDANQQLLYAEIVTLAEELEQEGKEMMARSLEIVAAGIRTAKTDAQLVEQVNNQPMFPTDADAEAHFEQATRHQYLSALFTMELRTKYGHSGVYAIRTDYQVVRTGYRHKRPDQLS